MPARSLTMPLSSIAAAALAWLLAAPTSSLAQEPGPSKAPDVRADAERLSEIDDQLNDARAALRTVRNQLDRQTEQLEERIKEQFENDPDVQALIDKIHEAEDGLDRARRVARRDDDPVVMAASEKVRELDDHWQDVWAQKHDEIKEQLEASDRDLRPSAHMEKIARLEVAIDRLTAQRNDRRAMRVSLRSEPAQDEPHHDPRMERHDELERLRDSLGRDLEPLTDAIRHSLSRPLDEIQGALKKERMTVDDLRRAMEKSSDELRESLRPGGPIDRQMREAAERAHRDLREAMEHALRDAGRRQDEMHAQMNEMREHHRRTMEQQEREMVERQNEMRRSFERMNPHREELEAAHREIEALHRQLREANERLEHLQRRHPEPEPRPEPEAERHERRLRELEEKMDRILREFEALRRPEHQRHDHPSDD